MTRGFTLLETLLYLGLLTILLTGALVSAYAIAGSATRNQETAHLEQEGVFLLHRFKEALREDDALDDSLFRELTQYALPAGVSVIHSGTPGSAEDPAYIDIAFTLRGYADGVSIDRAFADRMYENAP